MSTSHLLQMRGLKPIRILIRLLDKVASFTDAWIETSAVYKITSEIEVASFTDAWIETSRKVLRARKLLSHLLQMRGLKQLFVYQAILISLSHLLQMRGLKHRVRRRWLSYWSRIFYRCVD